MTCATELVHGVELPPPAAIPRAEVPPRQIAAQFALQEESVQPKAVWITSRNPGAFAYLAAGTRLHIRRPVPHRGIGNEKPTRQTLADRPPSVALSSTPHDTRPSQRFHTTPRFVRAQSIRHRPRPNGAQTRRFAGVARA